MAATLKSSLETERVPAAVGLRLPSPPPLAHFSTARGVELKVRKGGEACFALRVE